MIIYQYHHCLLHMLLSLGARKNYNKLKLIHAMQYKQKFNTYNINQITEASNVCVHPWVCCVIQG